MFMQAILNDQEILLSPEADADFNKCIQSLLNGNELNPKDEYALEVYVHKLTNLLKEYKDCGKMSIVVCFGFLRYGKMKYVNMQIVE